MENRELANELILHLHASVKNTPGRSKWSSRNFDVLRSFAVKHGAIGYPSAKGTPPDERMAQFLWDFIAHRSEGILIAAESEFERKTQGLKHDFEKLLYVRSPVKLMLTRVGSPDEAERQSRDLRAYMEECCTQFSPSEVFVLYCVWWSDKDGRNRDFAYILQIPGDPIHCAVGNAKFERVLGEIG